jgi:hypothetical protein
VQAALVVELVNQLIIELWGRKGAEQSKAVSFKGQTIKIKCENQIIAQEIGFKKRRILDAVNARFSVGAKKINIVQCPVEEGCLI